MAARRCSLKLILGALFVLCALGAHGCLLSFDDYAEGDPCAASLDAGIPPSTAPDPVLRGCDAGTAAAETRGSK